MSQTKPLDRIDLRIIEILQTRGRITNQELAEQVSLSPSSCMHRVRRLEQDQIVESYQAQLAINKLCRSVTCFANITMSQHNPESFRQFETLVERIPEIIECFTVSGSCDFILKIICPDMQRYLELNNQLIDECEDIANVSTHVVMNTNKPFNGYPLKELLEQPQ